MSDTPSRDEIARCIEALLRTRRTGQAVADYLEEHNAAEARQRDAADRRARRLSQLRDARTAVSTG
jgi:hypothetical protein